MRLHPCWINTFMSYENTDFVIWHKNSYFTWLITALCFIPFLSIFHFFFLCFFCLLFLGHGKHVKISSKVETIQISPKQIEPTIHPSVGDKENSPRPDPVFTPPPPPDTPPPLEPPPLPTSQPPDFLCEETELKANSQVEVTDSSTQVHVTNRDSLSSGKNLSR